MGELSRVWWSLGLCALLACCCRSDRACSAASSRHLLSSPVCSLYALHHCWRSLTLCCMSAAASSGTVACKQRTSPLPAAHPTSQAGDAPRGGCCGQHCHFGERCAGLHGGRSHQGTCWRRQPWLELSPGHHRTACRAAALAVHGETAMLLPQSVGHQHCDQQT